MLLSEIFKTCENIRKSKEVITGVMGEIQKLKDEGVADESPAEAGGLICPACGAGIP